MPLRKNIKKCTLSRSHDQRIRKRRFSRRKPARSSTLDSLDSRNSDSHTDELKVSPNMESMEWHKLDAQVIPFQRLDEWALFILLENTFGADNFKIEQTYEAFNIWAPRELREEDIESCMC